MAYVYCDQSLGTGTDAGTSWANAYKVLSTALNSTNVVAGDILFVKNNATIASTQTLIGTWPWSANPPQVFGVLSATTNEGASVVTADLIPGWRTGETRTEANLAYNDAGVPTLTNSAGVLDIYGFIKIYGLKFLSNGDVTVGSTGDCAVDLEECHFGTGSGGESWLKVPGGGTIVRAKFKNCSVEAINASSRISFLSNSGHGADFEGGKYVTANTSYFFEAGRGGATFSGMDFSNRGSALVTNAGGISTVGGLTFNNCQLHASSALVTGSISQEFRTEFYGTVNVTGKSSGTIQNIDIITNFGNVTEETTFVRTGGADDGGTGAYSLALTPGVNGTYEAFGRGLETPLMFFEVTSGTSKTVDVYIANSGAGDYNDDDVWLEVFYPSEGGTAQYDNETTQMTLLGTPAAVTNDTASDWSTGAGGKNAQKLTATIDPDYQGIAYCRVVFAKNFGASPETLYVDPRPVYT